MEILAKFVTSLPVSWIKAASQSQFRHPLLKRCFDLVANRFRNRDQTIVGGMGKGLRFNPGGTNAGYVLGTNDPEVQNALAAFLKPGAVYYDIGANVGYLSILGARLVGPGGKVFGFEPLTENAAQFEHNVALNRFENVRLHAVALGDKDATARFSVYPASTLGRLSEYRKATDAVVSEVEVPVRRLDSLRAEADLPLPDVIKIDVEGAEGEVLEGAAETLSAARPLLMIELHGTNHDISRRLDDLSYRGFTLGRTESVHDAPYWAFILAAPAERPEMVALAETVATTSKHGR